MNIVESGPTAARAQVFMLVTDVAAVLFLENTSAGVSQRNWKNRRRFLDVNQVFMNPLPSNRVKRQLHFCTKGGAKDLKRTLKRSGMSKKRIGLSYQKMGKVCLLATKEATKD